jgi:hypothetical protein
LGDLLQTRLVTLVANLKKKQTKTAWKVNTQKATQLFFQEKQEIKSPFWKQEIISTFLGPSAKTFLNLAWALAFLTQEKVPSSNPAGVS